MTGGLGLEGSLAAYTPTPSRALLPQSFFIVLEGGEGSGKTSLLSALSSALGSDVMATREPGGTPEGSALRGLLLSEQGVNWDPGAELLLMVAARVQHVKRVILPALAAGRIVLCDRFHGSTLAYQGAGRGLSESLIRDLHAKFAEDIVPDLTVYLDVDPRVGLRRSARRLSQSGIDEGRFETLDLAFHERVRASFLAQAASQPDRALLIDANRPFGEVQAEVVACVGAWLSRRVARN